MSDYLSLAKRLRELARGYVPDVDRANPLRALAEYMGVAEYIRLNFICTHISRRSHLGQVLAQVLAADANILHFASYSGGTEATAVHPNALAALQNLGINITKTSSGENPHYQVKTGPLTSEIFSKVFSDEANPQKEFPAILVCSSADAECPFVPGADRRISLPFKDPKASDGTGNEKMVYEQAALEIGAQLAWAFQSAFG